MEAETESPPRDLELSALEAEKEPMAARAENEDEEEEERGGPAPPGPDPVPLPGSEKNGLVKIPTDEELGGGPDVSGGCKFTGLGKEELLRAAGAPPWAKARALLLFLFWLGWLGMLGAAAAIVARAPRCRPLPPRAWWELGGLYRAPPRPFAGDLKGVAARLDHVAGLHMRGLVLGPLHPQISGDPRNSSLEQLDPLLGSLQDFADLLQTAKKKGLQVILDLTPNYFGGAAWLGPEVAEDPGFHEKVKRALSVWLERGVAGFFLDGIEELQPSVVAEWRNLTEQNSPDGVPRVLVGGTRLRDPPKLLALLNSSGVGLVLGPFLEALGADPPGSAIAPQLLDFLRPQIPLAWSLTPMPWDVIEGIEEGDNSTEARLLELCRHLGALRVRERSLSLGEAEAIPAGQAAAFLRSWDQSERFLVVLNPGNQPLHLALEDARLPPQATLRLSTHRPLPQDPQVDLGNFELLPYEGLLLSFPYTP